MAKKTRYYLIAGVALLALVGIFVWQDSELRRPVPGVPCAPTTAEAASAEGLAFNHTLASMRDPVNGVLVVAALGQPYTQCRMVLSTFRCEQEGPATVRVRAGERYGYYIVPEGERAVLYGDGGGDMTCTIAQES